MDNKVLEVHTRRKEYEIRYNDFVTNFITGAYELVELSKDVYQVEKSIELNKISLKDYVLNSDVCIKLKENNIENYTISDLKKYIDDYEVNIGDASIYRKALTLYEMLKEIEELEKEKINYLMVDLSYICNIRDIEKIKSYKYQELYNNILNSVRSVLDEELFYKFTSMINDVFNYYLYGSKKLPVYDKRDLV